MMSWQTAGHRNENVVHRINFFLLSDLELWPLTLIIKLVWPIIKVNYCTNFCAIPSNSSSVRALTNWQTDTQTDKHTRLILLPRPLTREVIKYSQIPGHGPSMLMCILVSWRQAVLWSKQWLSYVTPSLPHTILQWTTAWYYVKHWTNIDQENDY